MSDVHANPQALETALADARANGCGRFVFLGDMIGYGHDAKNAVRLVRENFDTVLMGNHDAVCAGMDRRQSVATNAHYDLDRAQAAELSDDDLEWICGLSVVHSEGELAFVHGEFTNPKGWDYMMEPMDVARSLSVRSEQILFCAHIHHARIWEARPTGAIQILRDELFSRPITEAETITFLLEPGNRYVVNSGSVGYPRVDPCITYVIYDDCASEIVFRRLPFDMSAYESDMKILQPK